MRHGSLFSGIGGFDSAAQWMGWDNVFHCEINPFGRKVLNYYWPNAISYEDITKTDFTIHRGTVDIITGGFPCQPFSMAGKRKGTADDRHLWPEMLRAIREIQPRYILGENVPGIINWYGGVVFEQVQADLENEGYEVTPFVLPACGVNAPHRRDRVWFVANAKDNGNRGRIRFMEGENGVKRQSKECRENNDQYRNDGTEWFATHTGLFRPEIGQLNTMGADQLCQESDATDTSNEQLQRRKFNGGPGSEREIKTNSRQFSGSIRSKWGNFPTQPPVCGRNDGLPSGLVGITFSKHRNESIKAYGNAVVPQVVYQIFKAIQQYDDAMK